MMDKYPSMYFPFIILFHLISFILNTHSLINYTNLTAVYSHKIYDPIYMTKLDLYMPMNIYLYIMANFTILYYIFLSNF